jgi:hypothetical protein
VLKGQLLADAFRDIVPARLTYFGDRSGEQTLMPLSDIANMIGEAAHEGDQDSQLKLHRKHIQAIWRHLKQLEDAIEIDEGHEIRISVGDASIILKKDGTIKIKGKDITIEGGGNIKVKAFNDITIKGQKILQN